jgi:hypothetical protein
LEFPPILLLATASISAPALTLSFSSSFKAHLKCHFLLDAHPLTDSPETKPYVIAPPGYPAAEPCSGIVMLCL